MLKTQSDRLRLVVMLAKREEDKAADVFTIARQKTESALEQLQHVEAYYRDYLQDFANQKSGLTASDVGRSHQFLAQMQQACAELQERVSVCQAEQDAAREHWQNKYVKTQNLTDYHQRCLDMEERAATQSDQKLLDDMVNNRHAFHKMQGLDG